MPGEEEGEAACMSAAACVEMSCMYTLSIWSVSVCGGRCTISTRNTYLIQAHTKWREILCASTHQWSPSSGPSTYGLPWGNCSFSVRTCARRQAHGGGGHTRWAARMMQRRYNARSSACETLIECCWRTAQISGFNVLHHLILERRVRRGLRQRKREVFSRVPAQNGLEGEGQSREGRDGS